MITEKELRKIGNAVILCAIRDATKEVTWRNQRDTLDARKQLEENSDMIKFWCLCAGLNDRKVHKWALRQKERGWVIKDRVLNKGMGKEL